MKFGNPVSSVTISGGTVAITAAGTLSTTGVVTSTPSSVAPPTATVNQSANVNGGTSTLLAAISGQQFLLVSLVGTIYATNVAANEFVMKGTDGTILVDFKPLSTATPTPIIFFQGSLDLGQLLLGNNVGITLAFTGGIQYAITLYYTQIAAGGTFTGHTIHT